eukprot:TRINITY_DN3833_c0_g1_i2.p1 TRINITY_DN3833_c0_g1~~TRINITY_DN3833_c0_g1_i2.p1  ORF type:complete len:486 (+),score=109.87 TRINITY_DN3833_c0_g1_i2:443-1900(+)
MSGSQEWEDDYDQIAGSTPAEARKRLTQLLQGHSHAHHNRDEGRETLVVLMTAHVEWVSWHLLDRWMGPALRLLLSSCFKLSEPQIKKVLGSMKAAMHTCVVSEAEAVTAPILEVLSLEESISEAQYSNLLAVTPGMVDGSQQPFHPEVSVAAIHSLADYHQQDKLSHKDSCKFLSEIMVAFLKTMGVILEATGDELLESCDDGVMRTLLESMQTVCEEQFVKAGSDIEMVWDFACGCIATLQSTSIPVMHAKLRRYSGRQLHRKRKMQENALGSALYLDVLTEVCKEDGGKGRVECAEFCNLFGDLLQMVIRSWFLTVPQLQGGSGLLKCLDESWDNLLDHTQQLMQQDPEELCTAYFELVSPEDTSISKQCFSHAVLAFDPRLGSSQQLEELFNALYPDGTLDQLDNHMRNLCAFVICVLLKLKEACVDSLRSDVASKLFKSLCEPLLDSRSVISKESCVGGYELYYDDARRLWSAIFEAHEA